MKDHDEEQSKLSFIKDFNEVCGALKRQRLTSNCMISLASTLDNLGGCKYHFFQQVCGRSALLKIQDRMEPKHFKTVFGEDSGNHKNIDIFELDHNCEEEITHMVDGKCKWCLCMRG